MNVRRPSPRTRHLCAQSLATVRWLAAHPGDLHLVRDIIANATPGVRQGVTRRRLVRLESYGLIELDHIVRINKRGEPYHLLGAIITEDGVRVANAVPDHMDKLSSRMWRLLLDLPLRRSKTIDELSVKCGRDKTNVCVTISRAMAQGLVVRGIPWHNTPHHGGILPYQHKLTPIGRRLGSALRRLP